MVVFILFVEDSHFCYLFLGDTPSQRARESSVGKTPSFSFSKVDMYAQGLKILA